MKKITTALLSLSLFVGCGAVQDWSGTYEGTSKRAATVEELEQATAANDIWVIDEPKAGEEIKVVRKRAGDADCTLLGTRALGSAGGYGMGLRPGQKCVIGDRELILSLGDVEDANDGIRVELEWKLTEDGEVALFEHGALKKK